VFGGAVGCFLTTPTESAQSFFLENQIDSSVYRATAPDCADCAGAVIF
jgi:hypothetical protein